MPIVMSLQCENHAECGQHIDGDEGIGLGDLDAEHSLLWYGQRLERELYAAAVAAGWEWTRPRWFCRQCMRRALIDAQRQQIDAFMKERCRAQEAEQADRLVKQQMDEFMKEHYPRP
jgi:hypothetical protein